MLGGGLRPNARVKQTARASYNPSEISTIQGKVAQPTLTADLRHRLRDVAPEDVALEYGRLLAVPARQREREAGLVLGVHRATGVEEDARDLVRGDVSGRGCVVQHHKAIGAVGDADADAQSHVVRALVHLGHLALQLHVALGRVDVSRAQIRNAREDRALLVDLGHWRNGTD